MLPTPDWQLAADPARRIGHAVDFHGEVGSTNDVAREALPAGEGRAVVADLQTAGRGRQGRAWVSPPGANLMVSVAFRARLAADAAWQLGFATALAATVACEQWTRASVKWPNDIYSPDGRKLGGILVETAVQDGALQRVVIGLGLNVNWRNEEMPPEIADRATSLADLAGAPVDRVTVLSRYLAALDAEIAAVEAGTSPVGRLAALSWLDGRRVRVEVDGLQVEGDVRGIDDDGTLVVATADGVHAVTYGDAVHVDVPASVAA